MVFGWALHDVEPSVLRPGDHIYRWISPVYMQHGIVLEIADGSQNLLDRVAVLCIPNWAQKPSVSQLRSFLGGMHAAGGLKRARYGVPPYETWIKRGGTCYAERSSPTTDVLMRARSLVVAGDRRVGETFIGATCEDMAVWCKTGKRRAAQVSGSKSGGAAGARSPILSHTAPEETSSQPGATNDTKDAISADSKDPLMDDACSKEEQIEEVLIPHPQEAGSASGTREGAEGTAQGTAEGSAEKASSCLQAHLDAKNEFDDDAEIYTSVDSCECDLKEIMNVPHTRNELGVLNPCNDPDLDEYEVLEIPQWPPALAGN